MTGSVTSVASAISRFGWLFVLVGSLALVLLVAPQPHIWAEPTGASAQPQAQPPAFRILLFSRTAAYRHTSIPAAISAITKLGTQNGFAVDATEDPTRFNDVDLAQYAAVVFLSTSGDVLDPTQQAAFERYIASGKGYVGIHSASDTEYDWPWYGGLVGAYFLNHPPTFQSATIDIEDPNHSSTQGLPLRWQRRDEWYNFRSNPRAQVHVLARLDESTYTGGTMGADHPIAWYHAYGGGRAWYTAGGHADASYREELFLAHILGGIRYAAGVAPAEPATATPTPSATPAVSATPSATPGTSTTLTPTGAGGPEPTTPTPSGKQWLPLVAR